MKKELLYMKTKVSAVVAKGIDAKADTRKKRSKESGRTDGCYSIHFPISAILD
jgi:uncharacterized protein Veg